VNQLLAGNHQSWPMTWANTRQSSKTLITCYHSHASTFQHFKPALCSGVTPDLAGSQARNPWITRVATVKFAPNSMTSPDTSSYIKVASACNVIKTSRVKDNRPDEMSVTVLFGSRPSDHYFRSVCLSVCAVFLSRLWSDFNQTRTHVMCLGLVVSPRI